MRITLKKAGPPRARKFQSISAVNDGLARRRAACGVRLHPFRG